MITIVMSLLRNATQESWTNNTGTTITITYTVSYNNGDEEFYTVEIPNGSNINLSRRTFTLRSSGKIVTTIGGPSDNAMLNFSFKVTCNNTNGTTKIERLIKRFTHLGDFTMRNLKVVDLTKGNFFRTTSLRNSFRDCDYLTKMLLPTTVTNLEDFNRTFYGCTALRTFDFGSWSVPGANKNIRDMDYTCYNCTSLGGLAFHYADGDLEKMERVMYRCRNARLGRLPTNMRKVTSALESFAFCPYIQEAGLTGATPFLTTMRRCFFHSYEEDYVYGRMSQLRTVHLPSSAPELTDVREMLHRCVSVNHSLALPSNATKITDYGWAFFECKKVKTISVPNNWNNVKYAEKAFGSCHALTNVYGLPRDFPECLDMDHMFQSVSLKSLTINTAPKVKTMISMFNHSPNIESITLPLTMNSLEDATNAFWGCKKLTTVDLPTSMNSVTNLSVMFGSSGINSVTLPSSLPRVSDMSNFINSCKSVHTVTMPSSAPQLKYLDSFSWGEKPLKTISFPNNSTGIITMENCFYNNTELEVVNLPSNMPAVINFNRAFSHCISLVSLNLPTSAGTLSNLFQAFINCEKLQDILLPSDSTAIENMENAFGGCVKLKRIHLPSNLNRVTNMEKAFNSCHSLIDINMPNSLPAVNNFKYAFRSCESFNMDLSHVTTPRIQYNAGNFASITTNWDEHTPAWDSARKLRFGEPLPPPPEPGP